MQRDSAPAVGCVEEIQRFHQLQRRLTQQFEEIFPDPKAPRTIVVVPSLTLDPVELAKISGVSHYEERMLCMLMLLRLPQTRLIYLTSQPVDHTIIDYYLHLLPGVPRNHARRRLSLLSCHDASTRPLTEKILQRPRMLERLRTEIGDSQSAHMTCFSVTALERTLAVRLHIPLYGCDPDLQHLGHKSGCREVFRKAGVPLPEGFENLRDGDDIIDALAELKRRDVDLAKAVIKLNEGFSGEGNAVLSFQGAPAGGGLKTWLKQALPARLRFEADAEYWDQYCDKFKRMQGIVEAFVDGEEVRSPSGQCRIDPLGGIELISTHEQVLGGPSGQVFLGCRFPADQPCRKDIQVACLRIAKELREQGVLGRFGIDFMAVRRGHDWRHFAIETNLRKGGTTHTYMMLQFLTDGHYDLDTGTYRTPAGATRYYYATDNLQSDRYRGLTADDLIDIAVEHELHFHGASQRGVVFHLIGALSEFGKLGLVCVAESRADAQQLYADTIQVLDQETR